MNEDTRNYVYVIMNEWTTEDGELTLSEVVDGRFFTTEDEAWDRLKAIAEAYHIDINRGWTGFDAPLNADITQEYYIEGLWSQ